MKGEREVDAIPARVLCIEDATPGEGAAAILAEDDVLDVERASSVESALEQLDTQPVDVVVIDLPGSEMTHADVLAQLRSHPACSQASILSISETDGPVATPVALRPRADAHLARPVEPRDLSAQVDALLRVRRAERHARSLARDWRVAFDAITDGILVLTRDGEIIRCNRAAGRVMGRPHADLVGRHYEDVLRETGRAMPANLPSLESVTGPFLAEVPVGARWYRLAMDPIEEADATGDGDLVIVFTDITELKRYEQELRVHTSRLQLHNRRQTEFLGLLAHELRNPLAAIAAAVDVMKVAPDEGTDALEIVGRQVENLARMVSDLLDVSRIAAGKIALQRHPMDVRECVRAAVAAARPAAESARHDLQLELADEPLTASVDRTRIEQLLANLLDNAIKYTDPGGRIRVSVAPDASDPTGQLRIEVSDSGAGLRASQIESAFEMFVQGERTLDRAQGGLGLGLTLVKRLTELHGGRIEARSDGPGRGSTFAVTLPRSRRLPEGRAASESRDARRPFHSRRVLLVEDNEDLRRLLAWSLSRAGHVVSEASTGFEGLQCALERHPDTIVLDLGLPGIDGYALARELRAHPATRDCQLIALTGYGSEQDRLGALEAGFDLHLVKPVSPDRLSALIERRADHAARSQAT